MNFKLGTVKYYRLLVAGFAAILMLVVLTLCISAKPQDLSGVPEEIQLLDTNTGQVFYLGMEKSQIRSKKLVKSDEFSERSEFFDSYLYEDVNMLFTTIS